MTPFLSVSLDTMQAKWVEKKDEWENREPRHRGDRGKKRGPLTPHECARALAQARCSHIIPFPVPCFSRFFLSFLRSFPFLSVQVSADASRVVKKDGKRQTPQFGYIQKTSPPWYLDVYTQIVRHVYVPTINTVCLGESCLYCSVFADMFSLESPRALCRFPSG